MHVVESGAILLVAHDLLRQDELYTLPVRQHSHLVGVVRLVGPLVGESHRKSTSPSVGVVLDKTRKVVGLERHLDGLSQQLSQLARHRLLHAFWILVGVGPRIITFVR